jgi:hypothetical protein
MKTPTAWLISKKDTQDRKYIQLSRCIHTQPPCSQMGWMLLSGALIWTS